MAFWSSDAGRAHNVLMAKPGRVVTSGELRRTCKALKIKYKTVLAGLARSGALIPLLFKGVYYVRDRNERDLGVVKTGALDALASACNLKLGKGWYFGLSTALFLSGAWGQQTQTVATIITKKRIQRKSSFAGLKVEFRQLAGVSFDAGVRQKGNLRYSEPARTVADYGYFGARDKKSLELARAVFAEVAAKAGGRKKLIQRTRALISKYPKLYAVFLRKFFEE